MKEHPILFSTAMVQAILEGRKNQTRRVVTKQNSICEAGFDNLDLLRAVVENPSIFCSYPYLKAPHKTDGTRHRIYSRIAVGDRLWVRETFAVKHDFDAFPPRAIPSDTNIHYRASWEVPCGLIWRPSIFMPRFASRILLEVTDIREQKIQDITVHDVISEGFIPCSETFMATKGNQLQTILDFGQGLWNSINAARGYGWHVNPRVRVYTFKEVTT